MANIGTYVPVAMDSAIIPRSVSDSISDIGQVQSSLG
jgi:hypothetical protein